MAGSLNKVQLIGNLGRDPEIRHAQDGSKLANLTVATTEYWKDKVTNERKDRTEWHRVVIFNDRLADIAEKYMRKGSKVYLEGQLQTRKWTDNNGVERYTTEIVLGRFKGEITMLDSKGAGDNGTDFTPDAFGGSQQDDHGFSGSQSSQANDINDEIPF